MERSIDPMPVAKMLEPPKPLTGRGGIAVQVRKSERSGEMWTVAPVSKMKGVFVDIDRDGSPSSIYGRGINGL